MIVIPVGNRSHSGQSCLAGSGQKQPQHFHHLPTEYPVAHRHVYPRELAFVWPTKPIQHGHHGMPLLHLRFLQQPMRKCLDGRAA